MVTQVELTSFKAFERHTVRFRGDAFLAGPNNAGKSTVIAALRMATRMIRHAQRRSPTDEVLDRGTVVLGYQFNPQQVGLVDENLRHEFRDIETRVAVGFSRGRIKSTLTAVWPPEGVEPASFFHVGSEQISLSRAGISAVVPTIGLVPVLSPLEHEEAILTPKHVRDNIDGRLSSRHFRNQLALLADESDEDEGLDAFREFAAEWVPEIVLGDLRQRGAHFDLFYTEPGRPTVKEIVWAGDGIQIWLQLLLHLFRHRNADVVILDEPDVYLHPDLQRRLVQLLEELPAQTITATHSPEMLMEAPPESVVWVEKTRRRSILAPDTAVLSELVIAIGSQFNIRLARALRAHTALFVEGEDMKMLRHIAATVGATKLATETGIAVISLGGYSNWARVEPFVWLAKDLLEDSVAIHVFLDRDYRSEAQCEDVRRRFREVGATVQIWRRKELESYLLVPTTISRLSGAPDRWVRTKLATLSEEHESTVWPAMRLERERSRSGVSLKTIHAEARREFDEIWADDDARLRLAPPKEILSRLNGELEASGYKAVAFRRIARSLTIGEVDDELARALRRVEGVE